MNDRPRQISDVKKPAANGLFGGTRDIETIEGILHAGADSVKESDVKDSIVREDGLPPLFIRLADALCAHLISEDAAGREALLDDRQIQGIRFAGGIDQRDWLENRVALNYVLASLGFDVESLNQPEPDKQEYSVSIVKVDRPGHVYILSNPSLPGLLKIGYTCKPVAVRVKQLSGASSMPTPFEVVASFETVTPIAHEARIHAQLDSLRSAGREFFTISEAEAIRICTSVIGVKA